MTKVFNFSDYQRRSKHPLCGDCLKNGVTCGPASATCFAIEIPVNLAFTKDPALLTEKLGNLPELLDLENSFDVEGVDHVNRR